MLSGDSVILGEIGTEVLSDGMCLASMDVVVLNSSAFWALFRSVSFSAAAKAKAFFHAFFAFFWCQFSYLDVTDLHGLRV